MNPMECARHAILSPFNEFVDEFNSAIIDQLQGESHHYLSTDSIEGDDDGNYAEGPLSDPDVLNSMTEPGMPAHTLILKVGVLCRLTRNFDPSRGLTKNTRVIVHRMFHHSVEVQTVPTIVAGETIASVSARNSVLERSDFRQFRKPLLFPVSSAISNRRISISQYIESRSH